MRLALISSFVITALVCGPVFAEDNGPAPAAPAPTKGKKPQKHVNQARVTIPVEGMSCEQMCAASVEAALKRMEGVASADVNFGKKEVVVVYDGAKVTPDRLVEEIKRAGFRPGKPVKG